MSKQWNNTKFSSHSLSFYFCLCFAHSQCSCCAEIKSFFIAARPSTHAGKVTFDFNSVFLIEITHCADSTFICIDFHATQKKSDTSITGYTPYSAYRQVAFILHTCSQFTQAPEHFKAKSHNTIPKRANRAIFSLDFHLTPLRPVFVWNFNNNIFFPKKTKTKWFTIVLGLEFFFALDAPQITKTNKKKGK